MFLIRAAFWIGLVVLLLPTDAGQQARLYNAASAAVERVTTFCDRNPKTCAAGSDLWAAFVKKAEFAGRMALDLAMSKVDRSGEAKPEGAVEPAAIRDLIERHPLPPPRGTLKPNDLDLPWRAQPHRTGA